MTGRTGKELAERAHRVQESIPAGGLFAGHDWRIAPEPYFLEAGMVQELESLGRVLVQFYRAADLLHRQSVAGEQPAWVAAWLDRGKPAEMIEWQRDPAFKNELPRVIRPDLLVTEEGLRLIELDSVPGGIGLTAWLNQVYAGLEGGDGRIVGGSVGMRRGFAGIFGEAPRVHIVVSEEAATYRPEMTWLAEQLDGTRFAVRDARYDAFREGDAVYRFFELFDLANVPSARQIFTLAGAGRLRLTAPPKPVLEEKMLFGLLWNRNLEGFWHRHLGASFFRRLLRLVPATWIVDPAPLPPHGAIPELNLTGWEQLKHLSQRGRDLVLKVSGFSDRAWGARGVYLGSDLSQAEWSAAVDQALAGFEQNPWILQRYHKPSLVPAAYYDFPRERLVPFQGRVRLCPYYFVHGEGDAARPHLGGVLATICPADKKIIHGMKEAVLLPCLV